MKPVISILSAFLILLMVSCSNGTIEHYGETYSDEGGKEFRLRNTSRTRIIQFTVLEKRTTKDSAVEARKEYTTLHILNPGESTRLGLSVESYYDRPSKKRITVTKEWTIVGEVSGELRFPAGADW